MLVVKIELHNANTGEVSEIGCMRITNVGGTIASGDYRVESDADEFARDSAREGSVRGYPRLSQPVWSLVARALAAIGFAEERDGG